MASQSSTETEYCTAVEQQTADLDRLAVLRMHMDDAPGLCEASEMASACIRKYQEETAADGMSRSGRAEAHDRVGIWQLEFVLAKAAHLQRFVMRAQDQVGSAWVARYDTAHWHELKSHRCVYKNVETGEELHEVPALPSPEAAAEARYIDAVEETIPSLQREHEVDAARADLSIRTCIDIVRTQLQGGLLTWQTEMSQLYYRTVAEQGLLYSAATCDLVLVARRVYGLANARTTCEELANRFQPEWRGELYLVTLHMGEDADAARSALPYRVALGIAAMGGNLGMERAMGTNMWHLEEDLLREAVQEKKDDAPLPQVPETVGMRYARALKDGDDMEGPRAQLSRRSAAQRLSVALGLCIAQAALACAAEDTAWQERINAELAALQPSHSSRRGASSGQGALPLAMCTGRRTAGDMPCRPLPATVQLPNARGCIPYRTASTVTTWMGKGLCLVEAARAATGSNRYTRATFGLPATGAVSIKQLVHGAHMNPDVPFSFVKQRPTTWAGLLRLPWGIYMGRVSVGKWDHMIVYDTWRHQMFLGGDRVEGAAPRLWHIEDAELADPAAFECFMLEMLEGLWKNIDTIYRVDVQANRLGDTNYI